ncbi:MAG: ABC transporter permease [Phycisphaerae bacterium]|nr:MAG: ABC transporter permease [Phycisphaerae bacterium]
MFLRRSLSFYRFEHFAVMLGVAVGVAVLAGSMIVGDSVRGSLRQEALRRLGRVDVAAMAGRFFREELADECLAETPEAIAASVITVRGSAVHASSEARVNRTSIWGIDDQFWAFDADDVASAPLAPVGREVVLNESLAAELGAAVGDAVLLRLGKASPIATDTLLGRRDDVTTRMRLTVLAIVADDGLAGIALSPQQQSPRNAFVSRELLQRQLEQPGKANAILFAQADHGDTATDVVDIGELIQSRLKLADVGLTVRTDADLRYVSIESDQLLIDPAIEALVNSVAKDLQTTAEPVMANLANAIRIQRGGEEVSIPYSTVVALGSDSFTLSSMPTSKGTVGEFGPRKIVLNEWAMDALGAAVGERVQVDYYDLQDDGALDERTAEFELVASVAMSGAAIDRGLTPAYPGITDAAKVSDWDPPFPVDLKRIKDRDEDYWDKYRAVPKAIVSLEDGLRLWHDPESPHGRYTSLRFRPPADADVELFADELRTALTKKLDLNAARLQILPVRDNALAAGAGSTDFGMLFVAFSFFLLASSMMLVLLLSRLNVERRSREIGLLAAVGFMDAKIRRHLISEGLVVAVVGSAIGLAGAYGYSWLMLAGLKSWWSDAVNAPFLNLHFSWISLTAGGVLGVIVSLISIARAQRGCLNVAPSALLSGTNVQSGPRRQSSLRRRWLIGSTACLIVAIVTAVFGMGLDGIAQAGAFFGSGSATLAAMLGFFGAALFSTRTLKVNSKQAWIQLGVRNAARHPGRSILTSALIACGAFLVLSLQAFRLNVDTASTHSAGGFNLVAESDVSLPYSLATAKGRESLGFDSASDDQLAKCKIIPFSLLPGDETSCQNLYVPTQPRIIGAPDVLIERGGFNFSAVTDASSVESNNPWMALRIEFDDGAIPVIGDEAVVKWQMHSGLGKDVVIQDGGGRDVTLRFVALLKGSVLQSELVIHADTFRKLYPTRSGGAFFLIDAPSDSDHPVESILEKGLADFGLDVQESAVRLREYFSVQNTYLSTFQTLGGMGLVLGSFGLTAVLLRNVWERRRELALMRALGFTESMIGSSVLLENVMLVAVGIASAVVAAIVAVSPQLLDRVDVIPWASLVWVLVGVVFAGVVTGLVALLPTLRSPMLSALRSE